MLNSVRTRLTVWYVGVLALVLISFAALLYFLVGRILAQETDENLTQMARAFVSKIHSEQSEEGQEFIVEKEIAEAVGEFRFRDYQFVVWGGDGRAISSTVADADLQTSLERAAKEEKADQSFRDISNSIDTFRVYQVSFNFDKTLYRLFVLHSLEEQKGFARRLIYIFLVAVPCVLLISGLGGYFLARQSLAPVAQMSRQAANIGATNLHERLPVKNEKDELGNLARVFNDLLSRLEDSFELQRRFMADASHELRTPLAIVRGESEVALAQNTRPTGELRESLEIVHDESKRLTKIVEDLFTLARADAGQFKTNFTEIYLDELLTDCVRAVRVLIEKRDIALEFSAAEEMPMRGDEQLLRRLFVNLLDNAIKYNREGGRVSVIGEKMGDTLKITITDTGPGILVEEREKIFERFYRADKARSRQTETTTSGAGLGLSIARWIAEIHQGKIELVSSSNTGSIFRVTFLL